MTSIIIDRRLNPRGKSSSNRQRFIQRNKAQIQESIKKIIDKTNISDIHRANKGIVVRGTSEPTFNADPNTGDKKYILPGNKEYIVGDKQPKPTNNGAEGKGRAAGEGDGDEDEFEFILTHEEYLDFIFQDLELPDLVKKSLKQTMVNHLSRAGYKTSGNPAQLDTIRSLKNSIGRRIGLQRPSNEYIEQLESQLEFEKERNASAETIRFLEEEIKKLKARQLIVPWIDPIDIRYRNYVPTPKPITQALMVCLLDVSASMTEREKEIAKRFFLLLNLFLKTKYKHVEVVFIAHTSVAHEVNEEEFFYSKNTGGTLVSSALDLTLKIIKERYSPSDWNIYVSQCSDGDNIPHDNPLCQEHLNAILGIAQYFAYIEVKPMYQTSRKSDLWQAYQEISLSNKALQMVEVNDHSDIWKVFRELFSQKG